MLYRKCGTELPEDIAICSECGTDALELFPIGNEVADLKTFLNEKAEAASNKKTRSRKLPASVLILGTLVISIVFLVACHSEGPSETLSNEGAWETEDVAGVPPEEEIPLYSISDVDTIDIYAINRTPEQKVPGMVWDSSLFYWLEDVSRESLTDGYLAKCRISKTLLRSSESGELIQYEVYQDPITAEIYKIVSIEEKEDHLLLTDYYYQNGIPNFVFVREDSVYTPTYATTDKTGERYYFAGDVMIQWRIIRIPGEIEEYTLSPSAVSYRQYDYFQEEESVRNAYDDMELRMLNAAYNTYEAIVSRVGIGMMEGVVKDTAGIGVSGVTVDVRRKGDNVLLYRTITDVDGAFRFFVYLDGTECFLYARGNEVYKSASAYGIFLEDSGITGAYGILVLNKTTGDEYPVHIHIYMAEDVRSGEDGSLERSPVYDAVVSLREGSGAREGEIFRTLQAGEGGGFDTALPSGTYTAQIDVPGCARTFLEIRVEEDETSADGYVLPALAEGIAGVVLTWECADVDLDLTLFTPFQSTAGDMAHVGGGTQDDGYGNYLVADNSSGCEVIYVNTAQEGNYKVYVSDYTDSQTGNYSADTLGRIDIHLYIYDSNGLAAEYTFPVGQAGVVWEVAEISGSRITPSQRVYSRMEGKDWWLEKKQKKRLIRTNHYGLEDGILYSWIEYQYDTRGNLTRETLIFNNAGTGYDLWYQYDEEGRLSEQGGVGNWNGDFPLCARYYYDSRGRLVKEEHLPPEEIPGGYYNDGYDDYFDMYYSVHEYVYDDRGNLTEEIYSSSYQNWETYYDSRGNVTKYIYYNSDGSISSWYERSYDNRGNETKSINYNSDGSISNWSEGSYDSRGNEIKHIMYNSDGSVSSWYERSYDSRGNEIKCIYYNSDGSVSRWYERSYDSRGNEIKSIYYNSDGSISSWSEKSYDSWGNEIKYISYDSDGSIIIWDEHSYDSRGNETKSIWYNSDGSISNLHEWSYDSRGYIIEEIESDDYYGSGRTEYLYE